MHSKTLGCIPFSFLELHSLELELPYDGDVDVVLLLFEHLDEELTSPSESESKRALLPLDFFLLVLTLIVFTSKCLSMSSKSFSIMDCCCYVVKNKDSDFSL